METNLSKMLSILLTALVLLIAINSVVSVTPTFSFYQAQLIQPTYAHGSGGGNNGGGKFTCPTIAGADSSTCSLNWSGYADTGSSSSVTYVGGSWTVPTLSCPSSGTQYAAIWVGIDGYNSNTVEQTGVLGECNNGAASYSAWYEFYPSPSVTITGFTVRPGDTILANVSFANGVFTVKIQDGTQYFSTTGTVSNATRSSAEWIIERPALCFAHHCSLTTLAPFGSVTFSSATATLNGVTGSISIFTDVAITMVASSSGPILAEPSSLSSGGSSFTDTYV
jgi:hypothetical protein